MEEEVEVFATPLFDTTHVRTIVRSLNLTVTCGTRPRFMVEGKSSPEEVEPLLFADDIWPGACALADYLDIHAMELCRGKSVVELGAGGALPSVVACKLGARICVASDYPAAGVVENIANQFRENGIDTSVGVAMGFIWGQDCSELLNHSKDGFDTILLSELLWKDTYKQHSSLLRSVKTLLAPRGVALVSFVHRPTTAHGPEHNLEFFTRAASQEFGFVVEALATVRGGIYADAVSGGSSDGDILLYAIRLCTDTGTDTGTDTA